MLNTKSLDLDQHSRINVANFREKNRSQTERVRENLIKFARKVQIPQVDLKYTKQRVKEKICKDFQI